jgi:FlaA1/EpsC-like NDP-sugar epimerase
LYSINNELLQISAFIKCKFILGSVGNSSLLEKIIIENKVDMIFHAAAYKHVPLVESNPIEGIKNNVIYSRLLCELSIKLRVKHMILISTDKAVRPTNIMGASKRLAEIILQSFAEKEGSKNPNEFKTIFSMVRFGNVMGSSGSVLPLFQKQIQNGEPITFPKRTIEKIVLNSLGFLEPSFSAKD